MKNRRYYEELEEDAFRESISAKKNPKKKKKSWKELKVKNEKGVRRDKKNSKATTDR